MTLFFGPVHSRRLGRSLGLDILPSKICSMDCLYCEVGKSPATTCVRREYIPATRIHAAIDKEVAERHTRGWNDVDVVTVTASGEPTLHSGLGTILAHLKEVVPRPVAILTNGSLCHLPEVRRELSWCDIIIPSLDAANEHSFQQINRPDPNIDLGRLIDGLADLSRECRGSFFLEILVAHAINDSTEDITALASAIKKINPDRLQLHTVSRPPAYTTISPVSDQKLHELEQFFNTVLPGKVDCFIRGATGEKLLQQRACNDTLTEERIMELLARRPSTAQDIANGMGAPLEAVNRTLQGLLTKKGIHSQKKGGELFFIAHRSESKNFSGTAFVPHQSSESDPRNIL